MNKFFLVPIYFFTFFTGAAGLIYEVAWQKYLSRILGSDSVATAVILATFLGGLSAGYYLCGKLTTKVRNHFKAYALLEGIIAMRTMGGALSSRGGWIEASAVHPSRPASGLGRESRAVSIPEKAQGH